MSFLNGMRQDDYLISEDSGDFDLMPKTNLLTAFEETKKIMPLVDQKVAAPKAPVPLLQENSGINSPAGSKELKLNDQTEDVKIKVDAAKLWDQGMKEAGYHSWMVNGAEAHVPQQRAETGTVGSNEAQDDALELPKPQKNPDGGRKRKRKSRNRRGLKKSRGADAAP